MRFQRVDPSPDYRILRFLSDGGRWELGLSSYQSGTRLRMGRSGRPPSVMDFCLGHDVRLPMPVLLAVLDRLEPLPESAVAEEIDACFPWAGTRPDLLRHLPILLGKENV